MQCDRAGLLAPGVGNAAMQTPQGRKLCIGDALLQGVRRPAQSGGRLLQVVLKQPGFSQGTSNREFILAIERTGPQQRDQVGGCIGTPTALQRRIRPGEGRVKSWGRHGEEYTKYTSGWNYNRGPCRWRPMASPIRAAGPRTKTRSSSMPIVVSLSSPTAWVVTTLARLPRVSPSKPSVIFWTMAHLPASTSSTKRCDLPTITS